jgi:hypothetical protein
MLTGQKIHSSNMDVASVLTTADDPNNLAKAMERQWRVTDKVQLAALTDGGSKLSCPLSTFQKGDFVEAAFTFEIVTLKRKNTFTRHIHQKLQHLLQIVPYEELPEVTIRSPNTDGTDCHDTGRVQGLPRLHQREFEQGLVFRYPGSQIGFGLKSRATLYWDIIYCSLFVRYSVSQIGVPFPIHHWKPRIAFRMHQPA